jgi:hypothetical protein
VRADVGVTPAVAEPEITATRCIDPRGRRITSVALGRGAKPRNERWQSVRRANVRAMGCKRVVIIVEREKTLSWDHSKLGGSN